MRSATVSQAPAGDATTSAAPAQQDQPANPARAKSSGSFRRRFPRQDPDAAGASQRSAALIHQNRTNILALKREQKQLREALQKLQVPEKDNTGQNGAQGIEKDIQNAERQVQMLRRKYDKLAQERTAAAENLAVLLDNVKDLQREAKGLVAATPESRHIRTLENRLEKAMMKFNEAVSIRRTYENLAHQLQQEKLTFDSRLNALRVTQAGKQTELQQLQEACSEANSRKEMSKRQLTKVRGQMARERAERKQQLEERKAAASNRQEAYHSIQEHLQSRRDALAASLQQAQASALQAHPGRQPQLSARAAFETLREPMVLALPGELVSKHSAQRDAELSLASMVEEARATVAQLEAQEQQLQRQLQSRTAPAERLNMQDAIDQAHKRLEAAKAAQQQARAQLEASRKVLAGIRAGAAHTAQLLQPVAAALQQPLPALTDSSLLELLGQVQQLLSSARESVAGREPQLAAMLQSQAASKQPTAALVGAQNRPASGSAAGVRAVCADDTQRDTYDTLGIAEDDGSDSDPDDDDGSGGVGIMRPGLPGAGPSPRANGSACRRIMAVVPTSLPSTMAASDDSDTSSDHEPPATPAG